MLQRQRVQGGREGVAPAPREEDEKEEEGCGRVGDARVGAEAAAVRTHPISPVASGSIDRSIHFSCCRVSRMLLTAKAAMTSSAAGVGSQ